MVIRSIPRNCWNARCSFSAGFSFVFLLTASWLLFCPTVSFHGTVLTKTKNILSHLIGLYINWTCFISLKTLMPISEMSNRSSNFTKIKRMHYDVISRELTDSNGHFRLYFTVSSSMRIYPICRRLQVSGEMILWNSLTWCTLLTPYFLKSK